MLQMPKLCYYKMDLKVSTSNANDNESNPYAYDICQSNRFRQVKLTDKYKNKVL